MRIHRWLWLAFGLVGCGGTLGGEVEGPRDDVLVVPPSAAVTWLDEGPGALTIQGDKALLFGFRYSLRLPPEADPTWVLRIERCWHKAGRTERCSVEARAAVAGEGAAKFEVDPSNYGRGENSYRLTLQLTAAGEVRSESTLRFTATVLSCGICRL